MRVLVLGGTAEAHALAAALHGRDDCQVLSSLAGRIERPELPDGPVRIGGFGGADGLADFLREERVEVVIDATHPFAAAMSEHAAHAAEATSARLIALRRPAWSPQPGDRWISCPDIATAARRAAELPADGCVFVTTGRRDLAAFAADDRHAYLIRTIDPPIGALPARHTLLLDRGPYLLEAETALMERHGVQALVTKNSGGTATDAKLTAARRRGIPVIMVDPPASPPAAEVAESVTQVVGLLGFGGGRPGGVVSTA